MINLYKEFGDDFVKKLRGDFAFGIVDAQNKRTMLARDQAGHKQLYYYIKGDEIVFSSDIADIVKNLIYEPRLNSRALNYYLDFRFVPWPETFFEGIKQVPPGHIAVFEKGNLKIKPYWERHYKTSPRKSEDYYADGLAEAMEDAVRVRLEGEGPIGAFLSGGLDSSTLVGLMAKINKRPIKAFTAGFSESDFNELPDAKIVADYYSIEHYQILIKPEDAINFLPKIIELTGQPFYDSTAIATYYAAKLAKEHVDTVLDAHGPDQQLASFNDYIVPVKHRLKNLFDTSYAEKMILKRTLFKDGLKERVFPCLKPVAHEVRDYVYSELENVNSRTLLEKLLYWDCRHSVPDYLMVKLESMTRLHDLDIRNPFLDVRVMDFILTIPDDLKLRMVYSPFKKYLLKQKPVLRYIMKKAFRSLLPEHVLQKKKQHFAVPVKYWLKNQLKNYVCDILLGQKALRRDIWDGREVKNIIDDYYSNTDSKVHYGIVWTLLLLEIWQRTFMDSRVAQKQEAYVSQG